VLQFFAATCNINQLTIMIMAVSRTGDSTIDTLQQMIFNVLFDVIFQSHTHNTVPFDT
jgi:hypothetical protein